MRFPMYPFIRMCGTAYGLPWRPWASRSEQRCFRREPQPDYCPWKSFVMNKTLKTAQNLQESRGFPGPSARYGLLFARNIVPEAAGVIGELPSPRLKG